MRKQLRKWGVGIATAAVLLSGAGAVGLPAWEAVVAEAAAYTIEDGVLKEYYGSGGVVDLPSTVKSIGNDAFAGSSITSIVIPSSVTSIGERAFQDCVNLRSITMPLTAGYSNTAFEGIPEGYTLTYTAGTEVLTEALHPDTFYYGCRVVDNAGKIAFAEGVTVIPDGIADGCDQHLKTIVIPSTCTEIGAYAFRNCTSLGDDIVLPQTLSKVGEYAFYKTGIKSVTVKKDSITLDRGAFEGSKIVTFDDFSKIKSMGSYVFKDCESLVGEVSFRDDLFTISSGAFLNTAITKVTIPERMESVDDSAFENCTELVDITMPLTTGYSNTAFEGIPEGYTLTYTAGTEKVTEARHPGTYYFGRRVVDFAGKIIFSEGVTVIPAGIADTCDKYLTEIGIPSTCTEIGNNAFKNCTSLAGNVVLPETLTKVGEYAFYRTGIKSVTVNSNAINLSRGAFEGSKVETFDDFSNIKSMGSYAFKDCTSLTGEVSFRDDLFTISSGAFLNTAITKVTFPERMESIGDSAFENCVKLVDITLPLSTGYSNTAFEGLSEGYTLTYTKGDGTVTKAKHPSTYYYGRRVVDYAGKIIFADGITIIPDGIASGCNRYLTEIVLPTGCKTIGQEAFKNCVAWDGDTFIVPATLGSIGSNAFTGSGVKDMYYYDTKDNWNTKFSSAQRTFPSDLTVHYMVIDPYVAPTCTKVGWTEGDHCVDCGEALNPKEEIPALGHKSVVDKAVAPTCTETGLTEGTHCSVCEEILIKQEVVEALGHKVVTDKAVPATCTETGLTKGTHCSRCKEVLTAQKEVPAKGHTKVDDPRVEPTCTEIGLTAGIHCSVCGEVFVAQESIPALGHKSVTDKSVAPTCTKTGLTSGTHCSVCSTVLKAQTVVAAKGHTVVTDAGVAPTCTEIGLTEGSHCSVCKAVLVAQEEIPATGHTKVTDRAVAATCTKAGLTKGYHCSVCKEVLTAQQVVPALGHDIVVDEAIAVGCETDGLTEGSHCARCGVVVVFQDTIPATGHHPVLAPRVEPTCTEVGWTAGSYCEYCGEVYIVQTKIAAKGHKKVTDAAVAATCTKAGLTAGTHCSVCNEVLKAQEVVEALGHNYVAVVTKPVTYSAAGEKVYTCSVCKHSYKETLPRLDLPFTDVKLGSWHESTVRFMLDNKLMSGKTATTFEPSTIMNRGQLVTILWNMEGKPKVTGTMNFTDVTTKSTFYTPILWASQNKIVNGYSNGEFRPKGELTREQIATILMNYTKFKKVPIANQADLSSFKDVASVNSSMLTAMKWAVGNKIISGKSGGTLLDPKGMASRIEVAAMVMNYCKNIAK